MRLKKNYKILHEIGSGSMASIHKGIQKSLDRFVAIKKIHPHLAGVTEFVQRFEREAKAAAGLGHVNIMDIIDFGQDEDTYFIVLEYIDGPDLLLLMDMPEKLPLGVAVSILIQVLNGLDHAHNKGVYHRDIKPANIMFTSEGVAKIADFGVAQASHLPSLTIAGQKIGTPYYMSPEQAEGRKLDNRSDLFSAGVILYKMLSGQFPFPGDTMTSVLRKVVQDSPAPLTDLDPKIPAELARIVDKALEKDPTRRFFDATEFAYALEDFALGAGQPFGNRVVKQYFEQFWRDRDQSEEGPIPTASEVRSQSPSTIGTIRRLPTAAILPLTGCFGCQVNLLDLHESIDDLRKKLDIRYMYFMDAKEIPEVDIGIVEGCVANRENEERLKTLRERSKVLVALGTCASFGGISGLRNLFPLKEIIGESYEDREGTRAGGQVPDSSLVPQLTEKVQPVSHVVKVDAIIPGCPSPHDLILESIETLVKGEKVDIPTKNLCHQCPRERTEMLSGKREFITNGIRPAMELESIDPKTCFLEQGILCMGIATREGCGARCLRNMVACQGCMGPPLHVLEAGAKWINAAGSLLPGGALRFRHDLVGMVERYTLPVSMMPMRQDD